MEPRQLGAHKNLAKNVTVDDRVTTWGKYRVYNNNGLQTLLKTEHSIQHGDTTNLHDGTCAQHSTACTPRFEESEEQHKQKALKKQELALGSEEMWELKQEKVYRATQIEVAPGMYAKVAMQDAFVSHTVSHCRGHDTPPQGGP